MESCQSFAYDAYGKRRDSSTALTNLLYSGEWRDSDLGMDYLRSRWYNPANGTFNRIDDYAGNTQEPQSLHKYAYCHGNPINFIDPEGLFTQQFGYLAEAAIQQVYAVDHPTDIVSYGGWTRLGGPLGRAFKLKPDILNHSKSTWLEIKPLTVSGVAKAGIQYEAYYTYLGAFDYHPEATWKPSNHFVIAGSVQIMFFNAGGIVFYTDAYDSAEDLLALKSYDAVKVFMRSPAGRRIAHSVLGGLSRVPGLVTARVKIDESRLRGYFNIAFMLAGLGMP